MLTHTDIVNLGVLITMRLVGEKIILDIEMVKATGVIVEAIMEFAKNTKEDAKC